MDDPVFKKRYQKYKLRVKLWEKDFKKKYGRVPSKYDIRDASQEIRDSYKMYYKLKTSFLEDTLNDVLSEDDGFDVFEMTQTEDGVTPLDGSLTESINGGPNLPLDISTIVNSEQSCEAETSIRSTENFSNLNELPDPNAHINLVNRDENHIIRKFEAVETSTQNENAWGSNVSKKLKMPIKTNDTPNAKKASFRTSLNPNKFQTGSSFAKRNPRKPLSRSSLNLSKDVGIGGSTIGEHETLPDLETILIKKAKEYKAAAAISTNPLLANERSKDTSKITQVDESWLERNTAQNGLKMQPKADVSKSNKTEQNNNATPAKKINYGLSNLDVSKFVITPATPTPAPVEKEIMNDVKKSPDQEPELQSLPQTLLIEQPTFVATKVHKKPADDDSDSDSVVAESEDEQESHEYRHIVKRRRVMPMGSETSLSQLGEPAVSTSSATETKLLVIENKGDDSDNESAKDFSVDEDEDASYVPDEPKSKRKKATVKRTKTVKTEKAPKSEKKPPKPKSEKKPAKAKLEKKPRAAKATARNTAKAKVSMDEELEEVEEQPLNPEELKYALALENGDLTSAPRIKLTDLEKADNMAQKYINTFGTTAPRAVPTRLGDEKRAAARRKLEEKIASGKLNENFVTINIEKKKYTRGKKSVNFSKYKKQQWKHKKHIAALSGPDMDMGGCDGGVLTCFTCGGVGHFARQCKVKGDTLLPMSAQIEEDPSPFPTLEEAQRMATQSALVVHGRDITKMPQATNAAILQSENKSESDSDNDISNEKELQTDEEEESTKQDNKSSDSSDESSLHSDSDADFKDLDFHELDAMIESSAAAPQKSPIKNYAGHQIPEEFLKKAGLDAESNSTANAKFGGVGPLYDLNADGSVKDVTPEVLEALHMFGHTDFRKGQDRAVMRILSGLSTLVTLSTGSGKSLCYQLPAYLYSRQKKSITLVISPLVSLMEDQVTGVPHFLRAHCMHTNQTPQQRLKIQQLIANGEVDILLVSPEAVVSGERSTGFGALLRQLPPIAFACIDEAHCVSQWSHNFRPSYLMICKVLKKNLGVQTVLGLTATATLPTRISIINHLGIEDGERGIISDIPLPDNLVLSISKDENRDTALLGLLNSPRFESCQSVIIYCTRRDECERIAGFIRTCMQDRKSNLPVTANKKRKRVNWQAEPYHAGMPASRRRTIQNAFMKNELRIVVATIAFGMGINKPDIRAIIHYNMPRNFESYVQEIGRAGRDGLISHCHLFLATNDQNELRRHIYSNSIDRHVIRKLLQRLFVPCACDKLGQANGSSKKSLETFSSDSLVTVDASDFGSKPTPSRHHVCPGHEIGFSIEKTVEALDIPSENISTLLCYMELDSRWSMQVLSAAYINAKVISYGGSKYLKHAAKECPPLAMAIALQIQNKTFDEEANIIEFSVVDIAAAIGWNSGVVKYQLKNLEWVQINGFPKRSPITVTFNDLGFRLKAPGDFMIEEIDDALDTLYNRSVKQETTQLIQLQYVYQGLSAVAYNTYVPCSSANFSNDRSEQLKGIIRNYFQNDYPKDLQLEIEKSGESDELIVNDIHALINMYPDNTFSGRNVARIFHGIPSPNYPAVIWGRCKFWRAHTKTDFNHIVQLANAEIVKRRM